MKCPTIIDLQLSKSSLSAIQEIERLTELEKLGTKVLLLGHLWSIFGGSARKGASGSGLTQFDKGLAFNVASSDISQSGYAIYSANWDMFFSSIHSLNAIKRRQIEKVALKLVLQNTVSSKEYQFWKAIYEGCHFE